MPRSHTPSQRSQDIWPKAPARSATQVAILLAIAIAGIFVLGWALDASRLRAATRTNVPVSAAADCPQLAETFDSSRAACLRRRWSAMRDMKPWRDGPVNAQFEECLRSPGGDVAVPFQANSCGQPKADPRLQRAQN
jgi:hypothetical protein